MPNWTGKKWISIALSGNGMKVVACDPENVFYSSDGGVKFENSGAAAGRYQDFTAVATSNDGNKLVAVTNQGVVWTGVNQCATRRMLLSSPERSALQACPPDDLTSIKFKATTNSRQDKGQWSYSAILTDTTPTDPGNPDLFEAIMENGIIVAFDYLGGDLEPGLDSFDFEGKQKHY
jgi:hypothetical protein